MPFGQKEGVSPEIHVNCESFQMDKIEILHAFPNQAYFLVMETFLETEKNDLLVWESPSDHIRKINRSSKIRLKWETKNIPPFNFLQIPDEAHGE
jgi:hypothetical protein